MSARHRHHARTRAIQRKRRANNQRTRRILRPFKRAVQAVVAFTRAMSRLGEEAIAASNAVARYVIGADHGTRGGSVEVLMKAWPDGRMEVVR